MPTNSNDLDLTGLEGLTALTPTATPGAATPHPATGDLPTIEELSDPDNAREVAFFSGQLDPDEHMKQASIRMDEMVGEICDAQNRQAAAAENMAVCFGRLVGLLEPIAADFLAPQDSVG